MIQANICKRSLELRFIGFNCNKWNVKNNLHHICAAVRCTLTISHRAIAVNKALVSFGERESKEV